MDHIIVTTKSDLESLIQTIIRSEMERFSNQKNQQLPTNPEFLTIQQASELLNLAVPTIYGYVNKRTLPYIKKGKKLLFKREALIGWLEQGNSCRSTGIPQNRLNY